VKEPDPGALGARELERFVEPLAGRGTAVYRDEDAFVISNPFSCRAYASIATHS